MTQKKKRDRTNKTQPVLNLLVLVSIDIYINLGILQIKEI